MGPFGGDAGSARPPSFAEDASGARPLRPKNRNVRGRGGIAGGTRPLVGNRRWGAATAARAGGDRRVPRPRPRRRRRGASVRSRRAGQHPVRLSVCRATESKMPWSSQSVGGPLSPRPMRRTNQWRPGPRRARSEAAARTRSGRRPRRACRARPPGAGRILRAVACRPPGEPAGGGGRVGAGPAADQKPPPARAGPGRRLPRTGTRWSLGRPGGHGG